MLLFNLFKKIFEQILMYGHLFAVFLFFSLSPTHAKNSQRQLRTNGFEIEQMSLVWLLLILDKLRSEERRGNVASFSDIMYLKRIDF